MQVQTEALFRNYNVVSMAKPMNPYVYLSMVAIVAAESNLSIASLRLPPFSSKVVEIDLILIGPSPLITKAAGEKGRESGTCPAVQVVDRRRRWRSSDGRQGQVGVRGGGLERATIFVPCWPIS